MSSDLYPLCFKPVYKDYIWGGDKIVRRFHRNEPPGVYAESWEVSDRSDGMSVVSNGPLTGRTLHELVQKLGHSLVGARVKSTVFPLLIKLIDSRERLSVQVHPNDDTAARYGGDAKTEMWYLLDGDPGAGVFAGLKPGTNERVFKEAMQTKRFRDILNRVPVNPGDAVFIPGGRVHAIDAGCLLLEVQQNSNTTYRIYDWDRVGAVGKPRALHLEEALRVINWKDQGNPKVVPRKLESQGVKERWQILKTEYFLLERLVVSGPFKTRGDGQTFEIFFVPSNGFQLSWAGGSEILPAGTSCLVPAAMADYQMRPDGGESELLRITVPAH